MSKHAIKALAQSLWLEWGAQGVSVTLIEPGFVASEIRQVNNQGIYKPSSADPVPNWLLLPAEKAAKDIARAVIKRRRSAVITFHGKVIIWLTRFTPWLVDFLLRRMRGIKHKEA